MFSNLDIFNASFYFFYHYLFLHFFIHFFILFCVKRETHFVLKEGDLFACYTCQKLQLHSTHIILNDGLFCLSLLLSPSVHVFSNILFPPLIKVDTFLLLVSVSLSVATHPQPHTLHQCLVPVHPHPHPCLSVR